METSSDDIDEIEQEVHRVTAIIGTGPDDDPDHEPYRRFFNLAEMLRCSFEESRSMETLDESIRLYRRSLSLYPESAAGFDGVLTGLAYVLGDRYEVEGLIDDVQECIELLQRCLELCPMGHSDRDMTLNNLGNALGFRYARHSDEEDLEKRIDLYEEALELCPPGHPCRGTSLTNLGNVLGDRYARQGIEEDLTRSIKLQEESLELRPPGHPLRDCSLDSLGSAHSDRYARDGDEEDLSRSIILYEESLELRPPGHPQRDFTLTNLGNALGERYGRRSDEEDLRRRIELYEESLELCPMGHYARGISLITLGAALACRYTRNGDEGDLERCIELLEESLELCPPGHHARGFSLQNLGNALDHRHRHARYGDEDDLKRPIELYEESLELSPLGHRDRDSHLNNLANALGDRYARHGDEEDLRRQIVLLEHSLKLRPPGHPSRDFVLSHLAEALTKIRDALGLNHYPSQGNVDPFSLLEDEVRSDLSTESGMLRCALKWVDLAEKHGHESLGKAYLLSVGCLRRYLSIGPTAARQYKVIPRQTRLASLPTDAAAYFIELGDVEQAAELLDEGRALLWSDLRRFREPLTSEERLRIGEGLSPRYSALCQDIFKLSNSESAFEASTSAKTSEAVQIASNVAYGKLLNEKRRRLKEHASLIDQIRNISGCEDFQRPAKFARLKDAAREERLPLLVPFEADFRSQMLKVHDRYQKGRLRMEDGDSYLDETLKMFEFSEVLKEVSEQLWDFMVHPVVAKLEEIGIPKDTRLWLCPTSFLTALPIHAAGKRSHFLTDHFIPSYTPTLTALSRARRALAIPSEPRILVVAQTKTSGLETAEDEAKRMESLGSFVECCDEQDASPTSVLEALSSYPWVHFICHGIVTANPFESSLILHNRSKLSLNDIIKAHLPNAKFAFLAACHTAELNRGKVLPDEVLHLAGAMQSSGFRSVVGTMWQMTDKDGPRLAEVFYKEMFAGAEDNGEKHTRAAGALRKAVKMMRRRIPMARWANYVHIGA